jgi:DNA-binding NarL/FixJ family response regulator
VRAKYLNVVDRDNAMTTMVVMGVSRTFNMTPAEVRYGRANLSPSARRTVMAILAECGMTHERIAEALKRDVSTVQASLAWIRGEVSRRPFGRVASTIRRMKEELT